jgi:MFS family permease
LAENIITFLPLFTVEKYPEMTSLDTGIILSVYQIACFIISPLVGMYLHRIGKKSGIVIGYFIVILATVGIGLLDFAFT